MKGFLGQGLFQAVDLLLGLVQVGIFPLDLFLVVMLQLFELLQPDLAGLHILPKVLDSLDVGQYDALLVVTPAGVRLVEIHFFTHRLVVNFLLQDLHFRSLTRPWINCR